MNAKKNDSQKEPNISNNEWLSFLRFQMKLSRENVEEVKYPHNNIENTF